MFIALPMSDLCQDARTLAASDAQSTPAGTQEFLAIATRDTGAADVGTSLFENVLGRFSTAAESRIVDATNRLIGKLAKAYSTLAERDGLELLPVLGLVSEVTV